MTDTQTITVRLGEVLVIHADGFGPEPGWEISGGNWMVTRRELPDDFPPVARVACELLRAFGEFTPRQRACANAALAELM